jgi:hypothetical protein
VCFHDLNQWFFSPHTYQDQTGFLASSHESCVDKIGICLPTYFGCMLIVLIVESVYSKPAAISVFRRIVHLSVLTRCQTLSLPTNALPYVQDEFYPPEYHYLSLIEFKSRNVHHADAHVQSRRVLLADLMHFGLSWHISRIWLLCSCYLVPLFQLLVHFCYSVYVVLVHACFIWESQYRAAVLACITTLRFSLHSHDFVALQQKSLWILLFDSVLYNLSQKCRLRYFCPLSKCLRNAQGFRKQRFYVTHRWTKLSFRVLMPPLSPTVIYSPADPVGGGSSRFSYASVLPYIVSKPSFLNDRACLQYVAYVDNMGLKAYPTDKFVHADIPLTCLQ